MSITMRVLVGGCAVGFALGAAAQTPEPPPPPKVIQIFREEVKPGKGPAHKKNEAAYARAVAGAKTQVHFLAMTAQTGPSEVWFISPYESFAAIEASDKSFEAEKPIVKELENLSEKDGEYVSKLSSMLAVYREEMSYRPRVRVGEMRYFNVLTFHVKPGHETDFLDGSKAIAAAHEKANMDEHWSAYQVVSGAPSGTFLVFIPMKSMSDLDASQTMHGKSYEDAIGEESQKKIRDAQRDAVASADNRLFSFSPEMSHVPPPMAAVDPAFWNPKPPVPATGAKKEKAKATKGEAKKE